MHVRRFISGDEAALFRVYHSAIHRIASRDYTREQVQAWAPDDLDRDTWARRIQGLCPFVAETAGEIVGYADLQPGGLIDHFFVSGHHPRRGIGTLLMTRLLEEAEVLGLPELTSHVSRTAEGFFVRFGFVVVERQEREIRGVKLPNALLRKILPR